MTLRNSIFAVSGAASFLDARRDMAGLFACDADGNPVAGVLDAPDTLVSGVASGMKVTVAPFQAVLSRYGALLISSDGDYTVSLGAAPSANSRIDAIYVKQNEKDSPMSDASDGPVIGVVQGSTAATPTAPTIPSGALLLAYVTVPAGVSNTTASGVVIKQMYPIAAVKGGVPAVRTQADLNALDMRDYSTVKLLADSVEYVCKNGAWVSGLLTVANATYWTVNYDFTVSGNVGMLSFLATRKTSQWQTTAAWGSSSLLTLDSRFKIARETHTPLISNANVTGLGGLMCQCINNEINLRATQAMTLGVGGWVSGSVVFGIR